MHSGLRIPEKDDNEVSQSETWDIVYGEGWFGLYNLDYFSIGFSCVARIAATIFVVHNAQIPL
jgi:hypothetical protein